MKKNFVKKLALGLALVMAVTSVPATSNAATKPAFKTASLTVEEGQTTKAVVKNTKGYTFKKVTTTDADVVTASLKKVKKNKVKFDVTGVKAGEAVVKAVFKKAGVKKTAKLAVTVKSVKPEVKAATATASKTITLTGANLDKLTAADVTVVGYTVVAYNPTSASATVTLDRMMVPNTDISVTVGTFTGSVNYNLTVSSLAVVEGTFDDDLAEQYVKFTVNGEQIDAHDMINNGYTVAFSAIDLAGKYGVVGADITTTLFDNPVLGLLKVTPVLNEGSYAVKVVVSNGTTVVSSEYVTITIVDLHASINSIDKYTLSNSSMILPMNSTTLVVGETATFDSVLATVDGIKNNEVAASATYASSNPAVISVDNTTDKIKAETIGSAVVTISYGNVKKELNFTVTNKGRVLTDAKVFNATQTGYINSKNVVSSSNSDNSETLIVVPLDQYNDPIVKDLYAGSTDNRIITPSGFTAWSGSVDSDVVTNGYVKMNLTVKEDSFGRVSIIIRDLASISYTEQTNSKTLETFAYNVTSNDTVSYKKLESVSGKYDLVVTSAAIQTSALVQLSGYNSSNVFVKTLDLGHYYNAAGTDLGAYKLTTTDANVISVGLASDSTGTTTVTFTSGETTARVFAVRPGKATVTLKAPDGTSSSVVFNVTSTVPTITGVTFNVANTVVTQNKTITIRDFFTVTEVSTANDSIIAGIATNVVSTSKVRYDAGTNMIYLDRDDNGDYTTTPLAGKPKDILLGYVELTVTGGTTGMTNLTTNPGANGYVKAVVYGLKVDDTVNYNDVKGTATVAVNVPRVY